MGTVDILIVGRTGNGKSSTGNSILGTKAFTPRGASSSVTDDISSGSAVIDGVTVNVVDGSGLGDTGFDEERDANSAVALSKKALTFFLSGFHALLIVLKYGIRFTKQEKDAIHVIKSVYGEDVVKTHGIVVMTYGDSFEMDMEGQFDMTFEKWCKEQSGDVQTLFKECEYRCVLFNNKAQEAGKLKQQNMWLMSMVRSIQARQKPYTLDDFKRADPSRIKFILVSKIPKLRREMDAVLDEIDRAVQNVEDRPLTPRQRLEDLEKLQKKVTQHMGDLQREDQGTGILSQLLLQISITDTSIKSKIERYRRTIDSEIFQEALQRPYQQAATDTPITMEQDWLRGNGRDAINVQRRQRMYIIIGVGLVILVMIVIIVIATSRN